MVPPSRSGGARQPGPEGDGLARVAQDGDEAVGVGEAGEMVGRDLVDGRVEDAAGQLPLATLGNDAIVCGDDDGGGDVDIGDPVARAEPPDGARRTENRERVVTADLTQGEVASVGERQRGGGVYELAH